MNPKFLIYHLNNIQIQHTPNVPFLKLIFNSFLDFVINIDTLPILRLDMHKIKNYAKNVLYINLDNYDQIGDILYSQTNSIQILLGNVKSGFLSSPQNYIPIVKFKNGFIWQPTGVHNYTSISMIFSINKPCQIGFLIRNDIVIPNFNKCNMVHNILNSNEYNLLTIVGHEKLTINQTKINVCNNTPRIILIESPNPWYRQFPILENNNNNNNNKSNYVINNKINNAMLILMLIIIIFITIKYEQKYFK